MNIHVETSNEGRVACIHVAGRFDFNSHKPFRECYRAQLQDAGVKALEVDLGEVEYIDSSALGLLLLLKEQAGNVSKDVALVNCQGFPLQVLETVGFSNMFPIRTASGEALAA